MKTIVAVPEFLTREQYMGLVDAVGFDVKDVRRLEFRMDGVYAEVYDRNEAGNIRIDGDDAVVNRVFIPVREPDSDV